MKRVSLLLTFCSALLAFNAFAADGDLLVGGKLGIGTASPNERVTVNGVLSLSEQTSHPAATPGQGKLYVLSSGVQTDSNDKLILHMDGANGSAAFRDCSSSRHSINVYGNAQISTAQHKYGGASAYFDGINSYLSVPASDDWSFGSGNFTIDAWVQTTTGSGSGTNDEIIRISDGTRMIVFGKNSGTNNIRAYYWNGTSVNVDINPTTTAVNDGNWHHVAFVRSGSNFYLFQDGVLLGTATYAGSFFTANPTLRIGGDDLWLGYIDELRISKGIARWTANFTLPAGPYGSSLYYKDSAGTVVSLGCK